MAFSITEWNLDPNRHWYVRLSDASGSVRVELYKTQSDAQSQSNLVASGNSSGYGSGLPVELEMAAGGSPTISYFNSSLSYHLKVNGSSGDSTKIFHLKPFVDLPDIAHTIYRSEDLIKRRAILEINKGTHVGVIRSIQAGHNTGIDEGTILRINSARRGINVLARITEYRILGTPDSLIDNIEAIEYQDLTR